MSPVLDYVDNSSIIYWMLLYARLCAFQASSSFDYPYFIDEGTWDLERCNLPTVTQLVNGTSGLAKSVSKH